MTFISRQITEDILFALKNNPAVLIKGPRQAGKSTFVIEMAKHSYKADYVSLDNATQQTAAEESPQHFLTRSGGPLIIDEIQLAPALFRSLKVVVDEIRLYDKVHSNSRFLLTSSADITALAELYDAMVGRMVVKTLYPLSVSEATASKSDFLARLFAKDFSYIKPAIGKLGEPNMNTAIGLATYPDISGKDPRETADWYESHITSILQRDVLMMTRLHKITVLPNLLRKLASQAGGLINDANIAQSVGLNPVTCKTYRAALEDMFLTFTVPPWHQNIRKRLVKSHKGYVMDTLLLCHMLGWNLEDMQERRPDLYGHVVENFVATEIVKQLSYSKLSGTLRHFRTSDHKEIDFVIELRDGTLGAIEVKSADNVNNTDFKNIKILQQEIGDDLICGIVLYLGNDVVKFGENLFAVPIHALWNSS